MMSRKMSTSAEDELREVFEVIDMRQDGFICATELYDILVRLGERVDMVSQPAHNLSFILFNGLRFKFSCC